MKNLLKSTLYLIVFALAGILFQISCSNSDNKSVSNTVTATQNKLIYTKYSSGNPTQVWMSNYDGTGQTQIPITLPTNVELSKTNSNGSSIKISPDGLKIFFIAYNSLAGLYSIYSCDVNGSNLQQIVAPTTLEIFELGGLN